MQHWNTLLLWDRAPGRLETVALACRRAGAKVSIRSLEVIAPSTAIVAIEEDEAARPASVAIFASGAGAVRPTGI
jgi:hypothetical protein